MSGPLAPWLAPLAWPASIAYGLAVRVRERSLGRGQPWQASRPVISVGNLSAGGTGKSPMVRWICSALRDMGRAPAIVTRGHRGGERSDEVLEHRMEAPEVPVAVGADRRRAIERLLEVRPGVDALVLDDGFQHRRVARDLDLVLVDAKRPAIDGALLPLGWLRESARALRRADAVIVTHADAVDDALAASIEGEHGRAPLAWARHGWEGLRVWSAGVEAGEDTAWLRGRRVAVWAGIGHRAAFVEHARGIGAQVEQVAELADHAAYGPALVRRLAARCREAGVQVVLCTAKDWVKLRTLELPTEMRFARPTLRLSFERGEAALRAMLADALARGDLRRTR